MNQFKTALISILLFSCIAFCQHSIVKDGENIYLIPQGDHTETIVYLHGLGDSAKVAYDRYFSNENTMFARDTTKVVLLTAPLRSVTFHGGKIMHAWFNIYSNDISQGYDVTKSFNMTEFFESYDRVQKVMHEEIKLLGGDSKKLFLGGFSQGCIMSFYTGLAFDLPLGGLMESSGFLVSLPDKPPSEANANTPIYISHGKVDPTVNFVAATATYDHLNPNTHKITKVYEDKTSHTITSTMMAKERQWFFDLTAPKKFLSYIFDLGVEHNHY